MPLLIQWKMTKYLVTMDYQKSLMKYFGGDVQIPILLSVNDAFIKEVVSTSQKQVVMKLIEDFLRTGDQIPC